MHIKVDEDIPPVAAIWLQERGYEASTVVDQGMGGWQDDPLWQAVQAGQQFLLTADKGFGDIRLYSPGSHEEEPVFKVAVVPVQDAFVLATAGVVVNCPKRPIQLVEFVDGHGGGAAVYYPAVGLD